MKHTLSFISLVLFAALLMTGCKSSSVVTKESPLTSAAYVQAVAVKNVPSQVITAKTEVELSLKGKKVNVNGSLKMKRNALVQLSFTFLGFEVGRMEFTPQNVLLVDRANKRYVRASYDEVEVLKKANLDFYTIQALFWNEMFIPGEKNVVAHYGDFDVRLEDGETIFTLNETPVVNYEFRTETAQCILTRSSVLPKKSTGSAFCAYDNFTKVGNTNFPQLMSFGIGGSANLNMTIALSRIDMDDDAPQPTTLSSRYSPMATKDVLSLISKLLGN
jgi:hypothetical protein